MSADSPEGADLAPASALAFPPCECGVPECPVSVPVVSDEPEHSRVDDDSPTMQRIRRQMAKENAERRRGGWL